MPRPEFIYTFTQKKHVGKQCLDCVGYLKKKKLHSSEWKLEKKKQTQKRHNSPVITMILKLIMRQLRHIKKKIGAKSIK